MAAGDVHTIFSFEIPAPTGTGLNGPVTLYAPLDPVIKVSEKPKIDSLQLTLTQPISVPFTISQGDGDPTIEVEC